MLIFACDPQTGGGGYEPGMALGARGCRCRSDGDPGTRCGADVGLGGDRPDVVGLARLTVVGNVVDAHEDGVDPIRIVGRVVAIATSPLDSSCSETNCQPITSRWGLDPLWWAKGDTTSAKAARDNLLANIVNAPSLRDLKSSRGMLLTADPGDVPPVDADVSEWMSTWRAGPGAGDERRRAQVLYALATVWGIVLHEIPGVIEKDLGQQLETRS